MIYILTVTGVELIRSFRLLNSEIGNDLVVGNETYLNWYDVFVSLTRR